MASQAAEAHIEAQRRLREVVSSFVERTWAGLPGYDEPDAELFGEIVVPVALAARMQASALTEAFLALQLDRDPLGVEPPRIRNGADPAEVYRRPFVTVWTALKAGTEWQQAVHAGQARATATAATDVQLAMTHTLREVGEADDRILGYQRVPNGGACHFCSLVSGQRYHTADLMPIHDRCGCGVDVITGTQRPDFSGKLDNDQVTVREHGELGPVLVDPAHSFTSAANL